MEYSKTLIQNIVLCLLFLLSAVGAFAQSKISKIEFCGSSIDWTPGKDSITLYFRAFDAQNKRVRGTTLSTYDLHFGENGKEIATESGKIININSGCRIPKDYTFSVLVDLGLSDEGKKVVFKAIEDLVRSTPDSCVYLSFFNDRVTSSHLVTKGNLGEFKNFLDGNTSNKKFFFGALYAKLVEFSQQKAKLEDKVAYVDGYVRNAAIAKRAKNSPDKSLLFVFTEGDNAPNSDDGIWVLDFRKPSQTSSEIPRTYAFFYSEMGGNRDMIDVLQAVCNPKDSNSNFIQGRQGKFMPANDMAQVKKEFEESVSEQMYDYQFVYRVADDAVYQGGTTHFTATWRGEEVGAGDFSIGDEHKSWPVRRESTVGIATKLMWALLVTLLTFFIFYLVLKVLVPFIQSKGFEAKYYKRYVPQQNVSRRICCYCKQEISEGQLVVTKCSHIMHVHCWKENGYKCAEYGQNCKTGIQRHVEWRGLFSLRTLKDCRQTLAGICAAFVAWVIYELTGQGLFNGLAATLVGWFYQHQEETVDLTQNCVTKTSAFLTIGLLLGFFLSLVFRYYDEYRKMSWKTILKILGLSLLNSFIGFVAFALGAAILCLLLGVVAPTSVAWFYSLPAYVLFSICTTLALTIKSSIPMRSALIGGVASSIIALGVLSLTSVVGEMNVLLDFILFGGGLGASLITVRMLAEKYFLLIKNGVRAGQRIPIHKWMNATGGGRSVTIGMAGHCEIQMNWEKSNKVAKEHAQLFIDHERLLPVIKPMAAGIHYNTRAILPTGKPVVLSNGDTFKIGDTTFQYLETE